MSSTPPSKSADQFVVRLPDGLREMIKSRAAANNRSMNAEIVAILGAAVGDESSLSAASVEALLKALSDRMGAVIQITVTPPAAPSPAKRKRASP